MILNNENVDWSLYEESGDSNSCTILDPLTWKDGDQLTDVKNIVEFFTEDLPTSRKDLTRILMYISKCGSGKSATILNASKSLGRCIIVAPFKNLQRQYKDDYFKGNKFILKKNGEKLSVAVIMGRNNFKCPFLEEQYDLQQKIIEENKKSESLGLSPEGFVDDEIIRMYKYDNTCANKVLPCTRHLRSIGKGRRESRLSAACKCKYWVPTPTSKCIIDEWEYDTIEGGILDHLDDDAYNGDGVPMYNTRLNMIKKMVNCSNIEYYKSVGWGNVGVFIRDEKDKDGNDLPHICPYYEQFYNYPRADVIVMNSAKWDLETQMGRKPSVDVEVFDEGDWWLDSHSLTIELSRASINRIMPGTKELIDLKKKRLSQFDERFDIIRKTMKNQGNARGIISALEDKDLFLLIRDLYVKYHEEFEDDDKIEQKIININTILRYIEKASISLAYDFKGIDENKNVIKVHIPYPDRILRDLFERSSKNIVITSGTIQENFVLAEEFGITSKIYEVGVINGRRDQPGSIKMIKPKAGLLKVTYTTWQSLEFRMSYNMILNRILDKMKELVDSATGEPGKGKIIILTPAKKYAEGILDRPDVHVDFAGNPIRTINTDNASIDDNKSSKSISTTIGDYMSDSLDDIRKVKPTDIDIDGDVLRTDKQVIVSTRINRGSDLRDDKCRGLIILKWPMSDISDGYNLSLKERFGNRKFWRIINDNAKRNAIQYTCRGLRHDRDYEFFASPDSNCFGKIRILFSK